MGSFLEQVKAMQMIDVSIPTVEGGWLQTARHTHPGKAQLRMELPSSAETITEVHRKAGNATVHYLSVNVTRKQNSPHGLKPKTGTANPSTDPISATPRKSTLLPNIYRKIEIVTPDVQISEEAPPTAKNKQGSNCRHA